MILFLNTINPLSQTMFSQFQEHHPSAGPSFGPSIESRLLHEMGI